MRKVTLQEQISRTLNIMGIINEAAIPGGGFISLILKKFAKNEIDVFYTAIEKRINAKFADLNLNKSVNSVLNLVNNNKIKKKEVLTILVDIFKQSGKDVGLFSNFIKEGAPTFFSDLQKLIKGNVSRQDIKGVLPELEDLPEEIFEDLLIKAGFKEATEESIDAMARSMRDLFPFLFREQGWFFTKKLANEERINEAIESLSKEFAGKNSEGVQDVIEKKLRDLETNIRANNLGPAEVKKLEKFIAFLKKNLNPLVYKKVNGQSVVAARESIKSIGGKLAVAGTVGVLSASTWVLVELFLLWKKNDTGSSWKDLLLAWDQEFGGTVDVVTRKTYREGSMKDLAQYLTDNYGKQDWTNPNLYTIQALDNGTIEMLDKEGVKKYFTYDKTNRTYFESDESGKKL